MRKFFRTARWIVLILAVIIMGLGIWKRDDITRLLAVNSLFDEDRIVHNFSHMDDLFFHTTMARGDGPVSPLPLGPDFTLPPAVTEWITDRNVTGLVILHDGQLVHESYYLGTAPEDRRISWSVAKSFLSSLTGILIDDGTIASIDDPVTKYAPALIGSAYDGATIRNVLQMSSGVTFNEDYFDFWSDINKMGRVLALGGSMDGFAAGLKDRFADPGSQWQYVSIDTHVIGMVLAGATGRNVADLMQQYLVAPMGLEVDPIYLTDGYGVPFVLGGLNLPTRDYARFGQLLAQRGNWQGQQIVPSNWIAEATLPSARTPAGQIGYGYQWWIPAGWPSGEFLAQGVYGQFIYVNQNDNVVVAVNSADRAFEDPSVDEENYAIFQLIASQFPAP
ncbi:MAG: serine hydrolase [Rhodobacterales bacterium]|nr:serine hydrolase [Rhodobacterales bacterium]